MMKFIIFAGLFAVAIAAPKEAAVGIEKAQFPYQWPQYGNGMYPWNSAPQNNYNQEYPIDYSMACSNQCRCASICVPWIPCGCQCPPPCPPATTTPTTTTQRPPLCPNGLPDSYYPFCCPNGAENWECEIPKEIPPTTTPPPCNGGGCCVPCMPCRPCMIWWMCSPCNNNCNNGCVTDAPTTTVTTTTQRAPLCANGLPDEYFPFCCANGAQNWECEIVIDTPPPVDPPCVPPPCRCQPCIPWMPCQPCSCHNPCQRG